MRISSSAMLEPFMVKSDNSAGADFRQEQGDGRLAIPYVCSTPSPQ
jgi:hypothetical protein